MYWERLLTNVIWHVAQYSDTRSQSLDEKQSGGMQNVGGIWTRRWEIADSLKTEKNQKKRNNKHRVLMDASLRVG
jgi:hypothetical protein